MLLVAALLVAAAIAWSATRIAGELSKAGADRAREQDLQLLQLFAPAIVAAAEDPRALLIWEPIARTTRQMFPDVFSRLDRASGSRFPFSADQIQAAHGRWTADWLAWEGTHDAEYKRQAAAVEEDLTRSGGSPLIRARLDAVEREKLDRYQRRYEEYVRVAKALQALGQ
jgi:hypothetical protein